MRAVLVAALVLSLFHAPQSSAKSTSEIYRLPAPLFVDPIAGYELPADTDPEPHRGMVLQGFDFDAQDGPSWATKELAQQAEDCGDRLRLPLRLAQSADLG